jgi:hypothetical protein
MRKLFLGVIVLLLVFGAQACSHHESESSYEVQETIHTHHKPAPVEVKPAKPACDCCKKIPIHRYYRMGTLSHYWTAVPEEAGETIVGHVSKHGMRYDGVAWYACA